MNVVERLEPSTDTGMLLVPHQPGIVSVDVEQDSRPARLKPWATGNEPPVPAVQHVAYPGDPQWPTVGSTLRERVVMVAACAAGAIATVAAMAGLYLAVR